MMEDEELNKLEKFFNEVTLPKEPVKLEKGVILVDVPLFIKSHISYVRENKGTSLFKPYYLRLLKLKKILSK